MKVHFVDITFYILTVMCNTIWCDIINIDKKR